MKKIIALFGLLITAAYCFAETVVIQDEKNGKINHNSDGFYFSLGDTFYQTGRLNEYTNTIKNSDSLFANGFTIELGEFKSDEDGLFDFVESDTFQLSFGRVNAKNNYGWTDRYDSYEALEDAKYGNFSFKDTIGPQVNFFLFSGGLLFGSKIGYDWLTMSSAGTEKDFDYKERRIFCDFVFEPYFSVNLNSFAKIFLSTEMDFPILRVRFIKDSYYNDYLVRWSWFKNDVPTTYKVGAVFFF